MIAPSSGFAPHNDFLIFPKERLCTDGIKDRMFLNYISISPALIRKKDTKKRSRPIDPIQSIVGVKRDRSDE